LKQDFGDSLVQKVNLLTKGAARLLSPVSSVFSGYHLRLPQSYIQNKRRREKKE
jgi:hypothetical protein